MPKRLLVVDDDPGLLRAVAETLRAEGYEVTTARRGVEALGCIAQTLPDLIVSDIRMPGMDGYEATRRIKADPALRHIPIVAVTSYALSGDEEKTRAAGCDGYVAKPFSPRQLLATVRAFPNALGIARLDAVAADGELVVVWKEAGE